MTALILSLTSLPYKQFRQNRHFYLWYDGGWTVGLLLAIAVMWTAGWTGVFSPWSPWMLLWFPVILYSQILAHVFVHNATHKAWPKAVNRLVGEVCGAWVVTRFASWEVVHQRHHANSDDPERDPHPVVPSYWSYAYRTIFSVEQALQRTYFECYGETAAARRYERRRAMFSFGAGVILLLTWCLFLGTEFFFAVYVPSAFLGGLFIVHFNWSTHNGFSRSHDFRPVNLDHGVYWLGNRLCFGIYFHANHHRRPGLFNPRFMTPSLPVEPPGGA
ncbi:MAG: fatty acid desaturase family protein [Myxococcota bacterium]